MAVDWVVPVVTAVLSGGFGAAVTAITSARVASRKAKIEERGAPAHIESVFLGSAEKAVAALVVALDRAEEEIEDLKRQRDEERRRSREKDQRISELEQLLSSMRTELEVLKTDVLKAREIQRQVVGEKPENPHG